MNKKNKNKKLSLFSVALVALVCHVQEYSLHFSSKCCGSDHGSSLFFFVEVCSKVELLGPTHEIRTRMNAVLLEKRHLHTPTGFHGSVTNTNLSFEKIKQDVMYSCKVTRL